MALIAPSLLAADPLNIRQEVLRAKDAGADLLHYDVMDGSFVRNITFGTDLLKRVSSFGLPMDVHLMMVSPELHIADFAASGASAIIVHAETVGEHLQSVARAIRDAGVRSGVALRPSTDLSVIRSALPDLDQVLILGVEPGRGGQKMLPGSVDRVKQTRAFLSSHASRAKIEFDGGVTEDNAAELLRAGVDILVAGSALFGAADMKQAVAAMRSGT